ncbi:TauD/TfdA family dioxygenase [Streptomyces sp. XD-27]|uniref:TauD/TfdA family dioxygenase n=1 Tax=Streptomyces sp. XD-27 TaxID=3062779 RepID=UPI0026F413BE|nr:TauD/TfdA family dioxygenase [Streptomyces sp. XD-27]WKX69298.1 TauD/TfdA family dioxygenase [Streptomyces sp. XD-27]
MGRATMTGWSRHSFPEPAAFRLPYVADHAELARRTRRALLDGPGFAVVTGVPVTTMPVQDLQRFSESLLGHFGVPLPQGRGADTTRAWLVRDEGVSAYTDGRRFHENAYTSKSRGYLHLHNDRAVQPFGHEPDYLALLTHRRARQGGDTLLVDGWAVHQVLRQEFPRELDALHTPFPFDRRHVTPAGESPVVWAPVFEERGSRVHVRCNVKRNETAVELTGAPLPSDQRAALDALHHILSRPELRVSILLEEGDCLITDDRRVLHGRTAYEDHAHAALRRCLVRVMLADGSDADR